MKPRKESEDSVKDEVVQHSQTSALGPNTDKNRYTSEYHNELLNPHTTKTSIIKRYHKPLHIRVHMAANGRFLLSTTAKARSTVKTRQSSPFLIEGNGYTRQIGPRINITCNQPTPLRLQQEKPE